MRRPGVGLLCLASVALAGCVTYLGHAKRAYAQGMYLEVAENLGRHEEDIPYMSPREQVDYGLYRGLALAELHDPASARRWLTYARTIDQENPGLVRPEQRLVIEHALSELDAAPHRRAPEPSPPLPPEPPPGAPPPDAEALSPSR